MWYAWLGGGGIIGILFLWTIWKVFGARRQHNPPGNVLREILSRIGSQTLLWEKAAKRGEHYALLQNGTMVTHGASGMEDRVRVERGETTVSFIYLEGSLIIVDTGDALCDTYHPFVRHNIGAARKLLNAVRTSRKLDTYDKEAGAYEADLRERKERASAHRTEVEEKLQRGKRKDDDTTEAGRKRKRG